MLYQFFSLKLTFYMRKICVLESIFFAKQELITPTKRHVQHFTTGKNFSVNLCHKQRFLLFFSWEIYFIRATENLFTVYACIHVA